MSKKHAYIFIERNMGNGYTMAYPPCSFYKSWIFRKYLRPLADRGYQEMLSDWQKSRTSDELKAEFCTGLRGKSALWHGYLVETIVRQPDEKCTDPLAKDRNPTFKMTIIMEGNPQTFPLERLDAFIQECIGKAYEVLEPGTNDGLKIEIPEFFFEKSEE